MISETRILYGSVVFLHGRSCRPFFFQYFHTFDNPGGTEIPAAGIAVAVPTTETTVFTAGSSLFSAENTEFGLGFKVIIPATQKAGSYSTTLNIKLADAF